MGQGYTSIKQMAEAYDLNPSLLSNRLIRGWGVKEALTTPVYASPDMSIFDSYISNHYNILSPEFRGRTDPLIYIPKLGRKFPVDHMGHVYFTLVDMCRRYDIRPSVFMQRLKNGLTVRQALTIPTRTA